MYENGENILLERHLSWRKITSFALCWSWTTAGVESCGQSINLYAQTVEEVWSWFKNLAVADVGDTFILSFKVSPPKNFSFTRTTCSWWVSCQLLAPNGRVPWCFIGSMNHSGTYCGLKGICLWLSRSCGVHYYAWFESIRWLSKDIWFRLQLRLSLVLARQYTRAVREISCVLRTGSMQCRGVCHHRVPGVYGIVLRQTKAVTRFRMQWPFNEHETSNHHQRYWHTV